MTDAEAGDLNFDVIGVYWRKCRTQGQPRYCSCDRMNYREFITTATIPWIFLIVAGGCSSGPETQSTPPLPPPAPAPQQATPQMIFETKTDTIHTLKQKTDDLLPTARNELQIRYMVQIGAFKDPHNASKLQVSTRDRYHMPVLNDYDIARGLYQIRIGFFESEDAARAFCHQLRKEHPDDYKDSWVIQLKR